ncbi:integration host factor subunit alpha [Deltaproteobacteria bacterium]|nr:integration host factor subunit alpha [Deltaproteobacteria bacterium]
MPTEIRGPRPTLVTLTKARLVDGLRETTGLPQQDATSLIEGLLESMKEALEAGEMVKISGFGNFVVRTKHARRGRNPHSGEAMTLPGRRVLTFKPSRLLRDSLQKPEPS